MSSWVPRFSLVALISASAVVAAACSEDSSPACSSDADCSGALPLCQSGACVACRSSRDCAEGERCVDFACEAAGGAASECDDDGDCPADRPRCLRGADEGVCIAPCAADDECPGGACLDGTCQSCDPNPRSRLLTDPCVCDQDCLGLASRCEGGICEGDCTDVGCPPGLECAGDPASCVVCADVTREAGEACGCDSECAGALVCIGGRCGERCQFDETCGRQECGHELAAPATCRDVDAACFRAGDAPLGQECTCNADCAATAPFCVGFVAGGARGFACSQLCGPEQPCPDGFNCCGIGAQRYCLSPSTAEGAGATCD